MSQQAKSIQQGARRAGDGVQEWGAGVRVVLSHGSITTGEECWEGQRPLAEQGFRLLVPDRRGYGKRADEGPEDFLADAEDIASMLGDGAHLVGHSYGGVVALLAAAQRPESVLSLAVIEPPAFAVAQDDPAVAELVTALEEVMRRTDLDGRAFLESFLAAVGAPLEEIPEDMLALWSERVDAVRGSRRPWTADIPLGALRDATFPKLVVSGDHHPAFDAVCDRLTDGLEADRAVIAGAGHEVPEMAEPFNQALLELWR